MVMKPAKVPRWGDVGGALVEPTNTKKDTGWFPGEKPPAEYVNWLLNNLYTWVLWLQAYENEAHVWAELQSFNKGINVSTTILNGIAVNAAGNGTGEAVLGTGGTDSAGGRFLGKGASKPGVDGYGDTAGGTGGAGVRGTAGSGAPGVDGVGNGAGAGARGVGGNTAGPGLLGTGGASSGVGVAGVGGSTNGIGVRGLGTGSGVGVDGVGGTTSAEGVKGTGGASSGTGVRGVGGSSNGLGVRGEGSGSGAGVSGFGGATDAPGVIGLGNGQGIGVIGTGGADATGVRGIGGASNGNGVQGIGDGTGSGVRGNGGDNSGPGVHGVGGSMAGPGVKAEKTGAGVAIEAIGDIRTDSHVILGSSDSGTSTPNPTVVETYAGRDSVIYGWASIPVGGTNTNRGKNVFSVARPATGQYVITMNTSLGDDANVSVWVTPETADVSYRVATTTVMSKLQITVFFRTVDAIPAAVNTAFRFGIIGT